MFVDIHHSVIYNREERKKRRGREELKSLIIWYWLNKLCNIHIIHIMEYCTAKELS